MKEKRNGGSSERSSRKTAQSVEAYKMPFNKINFIIMAVAAVMIVVGFVLMAGGATADGSFNPEIFSARRVVVGPTMAFLGFILVGVGIMWRRPAAGDQKNEPTAETETK